MQIHKAGCNILFKNILGSDYDYSSRIPIGLIRNTSIWITTFIERSMQCFFPEDYFSDNAILRLKGQTIFCLWNGKNINNAQVNECWMLSVEWLQQTRATITRLIHTTDAPLVCNQWNEPEHVRCFFMPRGVDLKAQTMILICVRSSKNTCIEIKICGLN
jgi:hypothetical protein